MEKARSAHVSEQISLGTGRAFYFLTGKYSFLSISTTFFTVRAASARTY